MRALKINYSVMNCFLEVSPDVKLMGRRGFAKGLALAAVAAYNNGCETACARVSSRRARV